MKLWCYSIYGNIKCENVTIYVNIKQMTDPWVKRQQNSIGIERVVLFVLLCPGECGLFTAWCAMICYVYMLRTIIKIIRCWEIKRKISAEFCSVINITVLSCFKSLLVDCQQIFYLRENIWNFMVSKNRFRRLSSSGLVFVVWKRFADISVERAASKTSVHFYQPVRGHIPKGGTVLVNLIFLLWNVPEQNQLGRLSQRGRFVSTFLNSDTVSRGARIHGAKSQWPLSFARWRLISVGRQYGTCFMSPFRHT